MFWFYLEHKITSTSYKYAVPFEQGHCTFCVFKQVVLMWISGEGGGTHASAFVLAAEGYAPHELSFLLL